MVGMHERLRRFGQGFDGNRIKGFAIEFERTAKGTTAMAIAQGSRRCKCVDTPLSDTDRHPLPLAVELRPVNKRIGLALSGHFVPAASTNVSQTSANDVVTSASFLDKRPSSEVAASGRLWCVNRY